MLDYDKYEKYDVFIKMLEIIKADSNGQPRPVSEDRKQEITTIIKKIVGDLNINQIIGEGITVELGERFENINQSIIASKESVVTGLIEIRDAGQKDVAEALERIMNAVFENREISIETKTDLIDQIGEITKQATSDDENRSKMGVIKAILSGLAITLQTAGGLAEVWSTWGQTILDFFGI